MKNKRLRMFAGPNGSGKTTVFNQIRKEHNLDLGHYLNADDIEKTLRENNQIDISQFNISESAWNKFEDFIITHSLFEKVQKEGIEIGLEYKNGLIINSNNKTHSYEASIITDFLRQEFIKSGQKLSFETVMSHPSKLETLAYAKDNGYRNYLYFISTESAEINKSRVKERVLNGGHPVPGNKIEDRYYRSLSMLKEAIKSTYRTFLFDNSESESKLILDIYRGTEVTYRSETVPKWVDKYCLNTEE